MEIRSLRPGSFSFADSGIAGVGSVGEGWVGGGSTDSIPSLRRATLRAERNLVLSANFSDPLEHAERAVSKSEMRTSSWRRMISPTSESKAVTSSVETPAQSQTSVRVVTHSSSAGVGSTILKKYPLGSGSSRETYTRATAVLYRRSGDLVRRPSSAGERRRRRRAAKRPASRSGNRVHPPQSNEPWHAQ